MAFPDRPKSFISCRICGEPTKYRGNSDSSHAGKVRYMRAVCIEESRRVKNERISEVHTNDYAEGRRQPPRHAWSTVKRVSPEEEFLKPWLANIWFIPQFKVNTGVHTNKLPRQFILDFAHPDKKLYIEIDGSVHRLRRERDARRDAMLAERGWCGLRIPAQLVKEHPEKAVSRIREWLLNFSGPRGLMP